jgi:hypothetical protein
MNLKKKYNSNKLIGSDSISWALKKEQWKYVDRSEEFLTVENPLFWKSDSHEVSGQRLIKCQDIVQNMSLHGHCRTPKFAPPPVLIFHLVISCIVVDLGPITDMCFYCVKSRSKRGFECQMESSSTWKFNYMERGFVCD